jgi:hypothetical protein
MPRLLTLLPCEKVLFGEDQTISLIVVLAEIHFRIFPNLPPPATGSVVFYKWAVLSQWEIGLGEEGEDWEQSLSLASKSGEPILTNVTKFGLPSPQVLTHRMVASLDMIPFLPEGEYQLIAKWKKAQEGEDSWQEGGHYPLRVVYDRIQIPPTTPTT